MRLLALIIAAPLAAALKITLTGYMVGGNQVSHTWHKSAETHFSLSLNDDDLVTADAAKLRDPPVWKLALNTDGTVSTGRLECTVKCSAQYKMTLRNDDGYNSGTWPDEEAYKVTSVARTIARSESDEVTGGDARND